MKILKISQSGSVKGHQLPEAIAQSVCKPVLYSTDSVFTYLLIALQTLVQDSSSDVWERRILSGDSPHITFCPLISPT